MVDRLSVLDAGGVYCGLNADLNVMSDVDTLAVLIEESLEELVSTVPGQ